jgi:hypothetical protein
VLSPHGYEQHFIEARQIIMPQEGAGQPPTGGMEKLHLDEVSGKMVSKSEHKRLQKQREAEEKKQKRAAAAAPPKPEKKKTAEELELNPNVCLQNSHRQCPIIIMPQANVSNSNTTKCVVSRSKDCERLGILIPIRTSFRAAISSYEISSRNTKT